VFENTYFTFLQILKERVLTFFSTDLSKNVKSR